MSTVKEQTSAKDQKIDPVVAFLKEVVNDNPKLEVAQYLLYANPNGSGVQNEKQPVYLSLSQRIKAMNADPAHRFEYRGLELPTKSVGMTVRMRFTIEELVSALEMLNLARARIYIENSLGNTWPSKPVAESLGKIKINLSFIKSMKSLVKSYLIEKLPGLIDDCYDAMYKSAGNFSYSLAETKLFKVHTPIMTAFLDWVETNILLRNYGTVSDETPIFTWATDKATKTLVPSASRRVLMDDMWVGLSYVKTTDSYKYPPHYVKLCKAICARLGKLARTSLSNKEEWKTEGSPQEIQAKLVTAQQFLVAAGLTELPMVKKADSKKKEFQGEVYEALLAKLHLAYAEASRAHQAHIAQYGETAGFELKDFIRHSAINLILTLVNISQHMVYQAALVYYDTIVDSLEKLQSGMYTFKQAFTKREFVHSLAQFKSGVCNGRVMDAVYRFISVSSLLTRDNSRKFLDVEIEKAILNYADLSKFSPEPTEDPAIVFSAEAMRGVDSSKRALQNLSDKDGYTGLRQNGVMSLTSGIKDKNEVVNQTGTEALLTQANVFDEIANCYANMHGGLFEARKADKQKEISKMKQVAKHTGAHTIYQFPQAQSPSIQVNVPTQSMSPTISASSAPQVDMFSNPMYSQPAVNMFPGSSEFAPPAAAAFLPSFSAPAPSFPVQTGVPIVNPLDAVHTHSQSPSKSVHSTHAAHPGSQSPGSLTKPPMVASFGATSPLKGAMSPTLGGSGGMTDLFGTQ